jgi:hypothetical protein
MKNLHPAIAAAALAQLDEGPRDEITRVRTTKKLKEEFAKCSAAKGLASATHAYLLMKREVTAHVRRRGSSGTGAGQRPVVHHVNMRRSW